MTLRKQAYPLSSLGLPPGGDSEAGGEEMSVWLKYLAIAVLVGNGLTFVLNLIGLGRLLLQGPFEGGIDRLALNLTLSFAAIALATLIAAPMRREVDMRTKIIAVPCVLAGAFGVLSSVMWLYMRTDQTQFRLSTDRLVVDLFLMDRAVQNTFFSACTLALGILVLASRRSSV